MLLKYAVEIYKYIYIFFKLSLPVNPLERTLSPVDNINQGQILVSKHRVVLNWYRLRSYLISHLVGLH